LVLPRAQFQFVGNPGPTYAGERGARVGMAGAAHRAAQKRTKLYFFEKFIDKHFRDTVVRESNNYVASLASKPRPPSLQQRFPWPPKWAQEWEPMTEAVFMRFLALLLWMGLHKTANEAELWSTHWIWRRAAPTVFFSLNEFQRLKAGLHCQEDSEGSAQLDRNGKPMLRKIGVLMERIQEACRLHYQPGADIAYDEISVQMSGCSILKKLLRHKPIGAGIQFWAFAESNNGSQYCLDFELDRNNGESVRV
jgi:hypothetical protein